VSPIAVICRFCNSPDTQAQLNTYQCLSCGRLMTMEYANEQANRALEDAEG
jgi:translation initiation factor 2 beta subunit (eIF-2beta)/eIF-5